MDQVSNIDVIGIEATLSSKKGQEKWLHAEEKTTVTSNYNKTIEEVDFRNLEEVTFTKPSSFSYYGKIKLVSSWKELYVEACACLYEDYPDIFVKLRAESIFGARKKWVVDSRHTHLLASPKKVADEFFIETNRSSLDLMKNLKWLLDMCSVDYRNVVISYIKETTTEQKGESPILESKMGVQYLRADKEAFYRWLLENHHKEEATCRNYVSAIRTAEKFAKEQGLTAVNLFTCNPEEAIATAEALFASPGFVKLNTDRHNKISTAITLLLSFYADDQKTKSADNINNMTKEVKTAETQKGYQSTSTENEINTFLTGDEFIPLRKALASQNVTTVEELKTLKLWSFMNRYNIYSIGTRQTIFSKVNTLLYPNDELSDDQAYVLNIGEKHYRGGTPADAFRQFCCEMLKCYPLQLRLLIGMRTPIGSVPISKTEEGGQFIKLMNLSAFIRKDLSVNDAIFYAGWIRSRCGEEALTISMSEPKKGEGIIKQKATGNINIVEPIKTIQCESIKASQKEANKRISAYVERLEHMVLEADMKGVSYHDAKDALNTTMVATKSAVVDSEHIVDIKGRLVHEEAFVDWEDGANQLESIIEKLMQKNNGYISAAQLYEYAKVEMNMFLTDNDVNDERSVYDIATHLFEKKGYHNKQFAFYGKTHISRADQPVTCNMDIFRKYAIDQGGIFSIDSLVEYLHGIRVPAGNLRAQMRIPEEPIFFYYESGILMYVDNMHIDETWKSIVKKELAELLTDVDHHIVLRAIPQNWFERLPDLPCHKPWTPLLLQSVLRCYGTELGAKTIQALNGQAIDTLHAMLVTNESPIQTFADVVVSFLVDNDVKKRSFEAEELRLLLVDSNIIRGNELIWNMAKALSNDERFAWNVSEDHVIVEV